MNLKLMVKLTSFMLCMLVLFTGCRKNGINAAEVQPTVTEAEITAEATAEFTPDVSAVPTAEVTALPEPGQTSGTTAKPGTTKAAVTAAPQPTAAYKYGNDPRNYITLGIAAYENDWIYYNNEADGRALYKIKTDGTQNQKVSSYMLFHTFSVLDGWIYGSLILQGGGSDGGPVCKMKTDGTGFQQLYSQRAFYPQVVNNWIYFQDDSTAAIMKIKTDGTSLTKVFGGENSYASKFTVYEDNIYFMGRINDVNAVYRVKTDGTGFTKIWDQYVRSIVADSKYLYCQCENAANEFCRFNISTGEKQVIKDHVLWAVKQGNYYYYSKETSIYRMNLDLTGETQVFTSNSNIYLVNICGDRFVVQLYGQVNGTYKWEEYLFSLDFKQLAKMAEKTN